MPDALEHRIHDLLYPSHAPAHAHAHRTITFQELEKHNTRESCWVVIDGQVYDATSVLAWHPAGPDVILNLAGKDAT